MRVAVSVLTLVWLSCGQPMVTEPMDAAVPLGDETCTNRVDDNGDGKIDCLDPKCFAHERCAVTLERCDNGVDDNADQAIDCADAFCAGQSCGAGCICLNGRKTTIDAGGSGGGTGASGGGTAASGGGTAASGGGTAASGGGTAASGGGTAASGGGTAASGGGLGGTGGGAVSTGGGSAVAGGGSGATGGGSGATGGGSAATGGGASATGGGSSTGGGSAIGGGSGMPAESNCADGIDNNGNQAIDCADSSCSGSSSCMGLSDGAPCLSDAQCAGQRCLAEATTGFPQGACANAISCNPTTNAGCNGGVCIGGTSFNTCRPRCTGTGLGTTGRCRAGYLCADTDGNSSNSNNYCLAACNADSECATVGTGLGCNVFSRKCGNKDRNRGKYGAPCTQSNDCESEFCITGSEYPGGSCFGVCHYQAGACGPGGLCTYGGSGNDNLGFCEQSCTLDSTCRTSDHYWCFSPLSSSTTSGKVCRCLQTNESTLSANYCCSGLVNPFNVFFCL